MISALKANVGQVLVPGDEFCCGSEETISLSAQVQPEKLVCGPGLRRSVDRLQVCKSGVLRHKEPNMFWIDSQHKRVSPTRRLQTDTSEMVLRKLTIPKKYGCVSTVNGRSRHFKAERFEAGSPQRG